MNLVPQRSSDRTYARYERIAADLTGYKPRSPAHDPQIGYMMEVARGMSMSYTPNALTLVTANGNFNAPDTGLYIAKFVGGGGGGGAGAVPPGGTVRASGGAAGASGITAEQLYSLVGGTNYAAVIGVGGTGGTVAAGASQLGGDGTTGGSSTFAGPGGTLTAPGGGQGQGGCYQAIFASGSVSGSMLSITTSGTISSKVGVAGQIITSGIAGGTGWSAINGLQLVVVSISGSNFVCICSAGTVPTGTPTALTGFVQPVYINGGVPGGGGPTFNSLLFGPGFGSELVAFTLASKDAWIQAGGTGSVGLAGGPGGAGGCSSASGDSPISVGGTAGAPGTIAGRGANGTNAGNGASQNGVTASNAANNTGAGGGGGGAAAGATPGTGGNGGNGGSGYGYILGPIGL